MVNTRRSRRGRGAAASVSGLQEIRGASQPRRRSARLQPSDWSNLPGPALLSILGRLRTFRDLSTFGGVCRAWRAVYKSAMPQLVSSLGPLLCCIGGHCFYSFPQHRLYWNALPSLCRNNDPTILDFSQGYLIMEGEAGVRFQRELWLVNPFTGDEVVSVPCLPCAYPVRWAVLTATPASPGCVLMVWRGYNICYWRPGDLKWSMYWCRTRDERGCGWPPIALEGAVYALNYYGKLLKFEFDPDLRVTTVPTGDPFQKTRSWLVASGGEILAVQGDLETIAQDGGEVYRLDRVGGRWVRMETIGDRALLFDNLGAALCDDHPEEWGGEGNCVYYHYRPHFADGGVNVFHMEGRTRETLSACVPLLRSRPGCLCRWFRWVLPRLCF